MMTLEFTAEQQEAIAAAFDASLEIAGPSRSGKTAALRARVERYERECGGAYLFARHPGELLALALAVLEAAGTPVRIADPIEARRALAHVAQPLFDLEWPELKSGTIDPEVAALRSPGRFLDAAYRLIRKLRDAAVDPQTFLDRSLAGATEFYAKPPNFAHAPLIAATKDAYRDSLDVSPEELARQYRREIDLVKILHRLYERYVAVTGASDTVIEADALARALDRLRERPELGEPVRARFMHVFVDEMQEATPVQRAMLDAVYGSPLRGVTFAGDAKAATSRFKGARPDVALAGAARTVTLPAAVPPAALSLHRAKTQADEAAYVAERVREELERGVAPSDIAVLFRSCADVQVYLDALLDRDIAAAAAGDVNVFADRRALDALALLWNVWDPFRHEWLLRTLAGKALALSDASVAALCADPPDPQTALFSLEAEQAPTERTSRWNPKRDVRLGWNVLRGDADLSLNEIARERVARFRELRRGWVDAMTAQPFAEFVRNVWAEGLAADGPPGSARERAQQHVLQALFRRLLHLRRERPGATLGELLSDISERSESDCESAAAAPESGFVQLLSLDEARGRSFAFVAIPDARAGSFPRWYVPDAFLWSPKLGMIPRENAGSLRAARTAKFTYYLYRTKARDAYNAQERCAFEYAISRARATALVTAAGAPTRGITAPEFLEELRARGR
ncbi:MAG TPA: UvrD-helicase domain-containing protein [Candidatus Acidoferrales bacterium]|nr:UvrD-helicase domain-containing protein [Candidatus Acidoferrales bacterium]